MGCSSVVGRSVAVMHSSTSLSSPLLQVSDDGTVTDPTQSSPRLVIDVPSTGSISLSSPSISASRSVSSSSSSAACRGLRRENRTLPSAEGGAVEAKPRRAADASTAEQ